MLQQFYSESIIYMNNKIIVILITFFKFVIPNKATTEFPPNPCLDYIVHIPQYCTGPSLMASTA